MKNVSIDISQCYICYSLPWEQCQCDNHCGKPDATTSIMIAVYPPLFTIGFLITPYLISCFIVWLYDKFRKTNQK
jgi:hypothetical protein